MGISAAHIALTAAHGHVSGGSQTKPNPTPTPYPATNEVYTYQNDYAPFALSLEFTCTGLVFILIASVLWAICKKRADK